jgi:hypothetical protein
VLNGFIWLRKGTIGGVFGTRLEASGFCKERMVPTISAAILTSQQGLNYFVNVDNTFHVLLTLHPDTSV